MARNNWDDEPLDADALMQQLGDDPRSPSDLAANRQAGAAAGNDMSWMDAPGATTVRPPTSNPVGNDFPGGGNQGQIGHITRGGTVPLGPLMGPDDAATRLPTSNTMPVTPPQTILGGTTTTPPAFTRDTRDALKYGNVGRMEGFNTGDYGGDVKARNSVKNTFGRIASRYANAPNSVEAMMADPDFKSAFPSAKRVAGGAGDKIDFGGVLSDFESGSPVGVVDVLTASDPRNNTANGWAWMPDGEGGMVQTQGGGPAAPQANVGQRIDNGSMGRPAPTDAPAQTPPQNADQMAAVMAEIQALQNGGGSPMEQDALLQLLGAV